MSRPDLTDREEELYGAIKYVLDRTQVDPDLGWYISPGTESFTRLCAAESYALGETPAVVVERRMADLQPEHRRRRADVEVLREHVEQLEALLQEHGIEVPEKPL